MNRPSHIITPKKNNDRCYCTGYIIFSTQTMKVVGLYNMFQISSAKLNILFDRFSSKVKTDLLQQYYGENHPLIRQRADLCLEILKNFQASFPYNEHVWLVRVPARVNLMGVHIDHRGGWCNYVPIARESFFCFSARDDDKIVAKNISSDFSDCEFSIAQELPSSLRGDWMKFIGNVQLERGHWGNYLKAGILKLQDTFAAHRFRGMNIMVGGDIPSKSGLSSSSSIVVGAALALAIRNELSVTKEELVELCGEGEWYVGTRGGAGDHSAMLLGQFGSITHTGFKPLSFRYVPFPVGYDVILCSSGIEASKSTNAREIFNTRIASYEIAYLLYWYNNPAHREKLSLLRDISPEHLQLNLAEFYSSLMKVPPYATIEKLYADYPDLGDEFNRVYSIYGEPSGELPLREVLLFGVGECDRAKKFPEFLDRKEIETAGELMYISHDGDRVSQWDGNLRKDFRSPFDDAYLSNLARAAEKNPNDIRLSPAFIPGGYRCSLPELDRLVDRCKNIGGVIGAGLTGAGLGGAILVLVRSEDSESVVADLSSLVSTWTKQDTLIEVCRLAAGASCITLPGE